jgi:2-polyprenyl-3-methyl-5-hydroxy-6-metoxy-1,4-benzoquinol methylase
MSVEYSQPVSMAWGSRLMSSLGVGFAQFVMSCFESERPSWSNGAELNEIVRHPNFTGASEEERAAWMMRSAQAKYESEIRYSWNHYFGMDLKGLLTGKRVMDLGSLYGGRTVAWAEKYQLAHITGIDVDPAYVEAATRFAESKQANADFQVAYGEKLPFVSESFDAVLTFDVLEHVQSPSATLAECHRVLKRGGFLCVVFPSYWQPIEHHLSLVTRVPGLQYLFSGGTLVQAYNRILALRGEDAAWYKRDHPGLRPWERCNTINGTTLHGFRKLIREGGWKVVKQSRPAIGTMGRTVVQDPQMWHRALGVLSRAMVHIPPFEEAFLHRIVFILKRE